MERETVAKEARAHSLEVERLPLDGAFTGQQARDALAGHVLAQAQCSGLYTLNPSLAG